MYLKHTAKKSFFQKKRKSLIRRVLMIHQVVGIVIQRIKTNRVWATSVNAPKKCIEFFIGFYVIFLSFHFLEQSFFGLKSMKNSVNSKLKINITSDLNHQIEVNHNFLKIFKNLILTLPRENSKWGSKKFNVQP